MLPGELALRHPGPLAQFADARTEADQRVTAGCWPSTPLCSHAARRIGRTSAPAGLGAWGCISHPLDKREATA